MKIEHLIVQHLYNNKKVSLQDIGSFVVSSDVAMPAESDKDGVMPENAITFHYNTRATVDESLIDFIVQQTRKIRPLAASDLESYSILGREYLNIGKPFHIDGLGTLQKNQMGQYEFIQGNLVNKKLQAAPVQLKEKSGEEIVFTTPARKSSGGKGGMILLAFLFLAAVAAALIYFMNKKQTEVPLTEVVATDTTTVDTTAAIIPPVDTTVTQRIAGDTSVFKVVIKEYPTKDAADKAYQKLSSYGHKLMVYQADSATFRLAMPFYTPLTDTLRARDSLQRFFGGRTFVEM